MNGTRSYRGNNCVRRSYFKHGDLVDIGFSLCQTASPKGKSTSEHKHNEMIIQLVSRASHQKGKP